MDVLFKARLKELKNFTVFLATATYASDYSKELFLLLVTHLHLTQHRKCSPFFYKDTELDDILSVIKKMEKSATEMCNIDTLDILNRIEANMLTPTKAKEYVKWAHEVKYPVTFYRLNKKDVVVICNINPDSSF